MPPEVEHSLVWSRVPFFEIDIMPESVRRRVEFYGSWGFTGSSEPPPSPSTLPSYIDALSEWHITLDKLKIPPKCTIEEEILFEEAGREINTFIQNKWPEDEWETAWFVNPIVRVSIPFMRNF